MRLDGHVHLHTNPGVTTYDDLPGRLRAAGMDGAILFGDRPNSFGDEYGPATHEQRLQKLMEVSALGAPSGMKFFPFYWIDPMEPDALSQVDMAVERGVVGFKVICNLFSPSDPRPMQVWSYIASKNKPILFHSGILFDMAASGKNNRPIEFEPLLFISGLRFAMAHISWPWCDELVAMMGKWYCKLRSRPGEYSDFFIDITPGTPEVYREDALRKLLSIYEYVDNFMFGTDNSACGYRVEYAQKLLDIDRRALDNIPEATAAVKESMYGEALLRFVGER